MYCTYCSKIPGEDIIQQTLLEQFPDCKELLDTYTDALHIEAQLECEADFERGFRLGAELMLALPETE